MISAAALVPTVYNQFTVAIVHIVGERTGWGGSPSLVCCSSVSIAITGIVVIIVIVSTRALVAAKRVHIGLVENDAKQVVVYSLRVAQRVLNDINLGAAPFNDEEK